MLKKTKYFSAIFLFSVFSVYLMFSGVLDIKNAAIVTIFTFLIVLIFNQANKYLYLGYVSLLSILSIVLFLVQQTYGPVDFTFCLSTYFTNFSEASSYINSVGYANFGFILLYVFAVVISVLVSNRNRIEIKRRSFLIVMFGLIFLNIALSGRLVKLNKPTFNSLENYSYLFFTPVLKVFADWYYNINNVKLYLSTQNKMLENFSKNRKFTFEDPELDKEIYVVVIGESVSKNYMHYYNADSRLNTPFLESSPNIRFNNYVASACNTVNSLTKLLTFNNSQSSIIDLLKEARNNKVAWISSQAQIGKHENPVSTFALQADTTVFITSKLNVASDLDAIKYVPKLGKQYKVVFVHVFGSHPNPCDRLPETQLNNDLDCYSETILKLDGQLGYLQQYLKSNFKSYKLLYLSDHGIVNNNGKI